MTVTSVDLFDETSLDVLTPVSLYTPPAGSRARCEALWVVNTTTLGVVFDVCRIAHTRARARLWRVTIPGATTWVLRDPFLILRPDTPLIVKVDTIEALTVSASGYLFT